MGSKNGKTHLLYTQRKNGQNNLGLEKSYSSSAGARSQNGYQNASCALALFYFLLGTVKGTNIGNI
jgi:hypothetical protein